MTEILANLASTWVRPAITRSSIHHRNLTPARSAPFRPTVMDFTIWLAMCRAFVGTGTEPPTPEAAIHRDRHPGPDVLSVGEIGTTTPPTRVAPIATSFHQPISATTSACVVSL